MKKLIFATLACMFLSNNALADQWYIYYMTSKDISLVNIDKVKCKKGNCLVWGAVVAASRELPADLTIVKQFINCETETYKHTAFYDYKNAKQIASIRSDNSEWKDIQPESVGSLLLKAVCNPKNRNKNLIIPVKSSLAEYTSTLQDLHELITNKRAAK